MLGAIPAIPRQAPTVPASVRDWKRPEASAAPTSTPAGNDGTAARNPSCEACQGVIRLLPLFCPDNPCFYVFVPTIENGEERCIRMYSSFYSDH